MSRKSFTAIFERCDSDVGLDGMAAVFNEAVAPDKSIHITEIRTMIRPINPDVTNILGNQGIISLDRISAVTGGTEVVPDKHDTDASDLPSQVKLYENPDSVTFTSTVRRFGDCISSYTILKSISFQAMMRAPGICDANDHSGRTCEGHNVWHVDGDTDTEPLVLNPGEGFALVRREFGLPQAFHFGVTVRVVGTSRTYKYRDGDVGSVLGKGMASIAFINGAGSGVVLQVMIVSLPDLGEENIPRYRIMRCGAGMDADKAGKAVTVVPHDTGNAVTEVTAYRGAMKVLPLAASLGMQVDYHNYANSPITTLMQQRADNFRCWLGAGPYISETGTVTLDPAMLSRSEFEVWPGDRRGGNSQTEIILWPGQGIAVVGGGAGFIETSEQAYLDIEITGYVEDPYDPQEIAAAVWARSGRSLTA